MIDFTRLDKTIHEKGRLAIMTMLAGRGETAFQELKSDLGMSDGNLITHIRALTGAGYVEELKDDSGRRPRTSYRLTSAGDDAFRTYLDVLEEIVKNARPG
jgi:DNA-binding HxlR family transcriptional regulator